MGSYLFSDRSDCTVTCDDDINTLKYISTKSKELKFNINLKENNFSIKIIEFFKYLHQKFKFTHDLQKLCMTVSGNLIDQESLEFFLNIQKHINKFALYKKHKPMNNTITEASSFHIKIEFNDAIYFVKQIYSENSPTRQLNYFGIFSFTKNYSNKQITEFLLNENQCEYDHMLPSFIQSKHYSLVFEDLSHYIESYGVDNIKLPSFIIQANKTDYFEELKDFLNKPKLRVRLRVIDLSFVIFASNLSEISTQIKRISTSFKINANEGSDYIYRFYLFTKFNNLLNLDGIKKMFAKGISLLNPKINSYVILYLFIPKYIKLSTSYINPGYLDNIRDSITRDIDQEDQRKRKSESWKNRNQDESYVPLIKSALLTKNLLKIYTSTNFTVWSLIYSIYAKDSEVQALKKKSILSVITKFISIRFKIKKYNDENDRKVKNIVNLAYLQSLEEYKTSYVMYPRNEIELHQDLVYIHYDQIFRILRYPQEN